MKTKILLSVTLLFMTIVAVASPITEIEAQQKATDFMFDKKSNGKIIQSKALITDTPKFTTAELCDAFYVFNDETSGGYVIVSADDRMPAVLGYSYTGTFKSDEIPENMRAWLNGYKEQYEYMLENDDATAVSTTSVHGEKISPLLISQWSQWYPYNAKCPTVNGKSTPTGCVATAMAQIMFYHQWPKQTTQTIPGYTTTTNNIVVPSIERTTIDWDNMQPTYNSIISTEQEEAVSTLFKLCGTAVKMDYKVDESGSSQGNAMHALSVFFGYPDYSMSIIHSSTYQQDTWKQMIYDEIKENRPVMFSASPADGIGHEFVVDGYGGNDYFHVNWGWGGNQDGYFLLNALNEYKYYQSALIGIKNPNTPEGPLYAYATYKDNTLTFHYDTQREERQETLYTHLLPIYDSNYRDVPEWYDNASNITSVEFDKKFADCKLISTACWFQDFVNLKNIDLSILNTQNVTDMGSMFSGCSSLTSLDLSSFNTQNVTYMGSMFSGCSSLTSLDLSSFNTQNVTDIGSMFYGCSSLTSLDLSNFNTQNVTGMSAMFYNCNNLENVDLSSFNTQNVTDMSWMFRDCNKLKTLDISNFKTQNVTDMGSMFSGCSSLISLNLSNFNTQNVTYMWAMFKECSSLTSLDVSKFVTRNVTGMDQMFSGCSSLTSLNLSNFNTQNVTNMSYMFKECNSLKNIDLSSFNTQNVTYMGSMFSGCSSLTSLDLSNFNTQNVTGMNQMFSGCSSLTSLDLSNFNTQNVTGMIAMFNECSNLKEIDVNNFNTQNVTYMGSMFSGCSALTSLDVRNFNTQNVTDMYGMFSGCSSLTSLDLSNFNTQNVTGMGHMFSGCSSLTSLDLSSFNTQNVTSMGWMFRSADNLRTIYVGDNWNIEKLTSSVCMFLGCEQLVGQDGTKYNSAYIDATKAHYDAGGYLTYRGSSAVNEVKSNASGSLTKKYYSINGKRLSQPQKGLNIIRMSDGTTRKIVSK